MKKNKPESIDLYLYGEKSYPAEFLADRLGISVYRGRQIIRAVNSHQDLLERLKLFHSKFHADKMVKCGGKKCSTFQLIAKAEKPL